MDNDFKDRVKATSPIAEVVGQLIPLKRNIGRCPRHEDSSPSFSVSPARGICKCWAGCTTGHPYSNRDGSLDVFGFMQWYYDIDFKEALKRLSGKTGGYFTTTNPPLKSNDKRESTNLKVLPIPRAFSPLAELGNYGRPLEYLRSRAVTSLQIVMYDISYVTSGRYRDRLIFPVRVGGEFRGFAARAIGNVKLKYLYPKGTKSLFGYDIASGFKNCVLVEGVFDALRVGFDAIAILGSSISMEQVALLYGAGFRRITVMLDGDAFEKSVRICKQLESYFNVYQVILTEGDPGKLNHRDLRRLIQEAPRFGSSESLKEIINERVHS